MNNNKGLTSVLYGAGLIFMLLGYTQAAYALDVSLATMIENLADTIPELSKLVTAASYVMGMFLVMRGVIEFKHFGEQRSMMTTEHTIKTPLIYLAVGAALLYFPSSVQVGMSSFWDTPNPYGYIDEGTDPWSQLINSIFTIIQLVGVIAFIRGLVLLTHLGGHHAQHGTFGRAVAHIIGGVFCINIYQFIQAVVVTLTVGG